MAEMSPVSMCSRLRIMTLTLPQSAGNKTVELIRDICKDGEFIAYPGTEWCGSSCAGGDHNVVFLHDDEPEFPFLKDGTHVRSVDWNEDSGTTEAVPGAWPLEELWAAYIDDPEGHLLIPHVGGRRCILDWHHPVLEKLIENRFFLGTFWLAVSRGDGARLQDRCQYGG